MPINSIYDWFHPDLTEASAKDFLVKYPYEPLDREGLFLVHPSALAYTDVKFVMTCKWKGTVQQYNICFDKKSLKYQIEGREYENLQSLVEACRIRVFMESESEFYDESIFHIKHNIVWTKKPKTRYYHGLLIRSKAEKMLEEFVGFRKSCSAYLIRDSTTRPGELIASILQIRKSDNKQEKVHRPIIRKILSNRDTYTTMDCTGNTVEELFENLSKKLPACYWELQAVYSRNFSDVQYENLPIMLPQEIINMDEVSIEKFRSALEDESLAYYHLRVMMIGHYGAGKTTLCKQLLMEKFDKQDIIRTDGLEIHTRQGSINIMNKTWSRNILKDENMRAIARIYKQFVEENQGMICRQGPVTGVKEDHDVQDQSNAGNSAVDHVKNVVSKFEKVLRPCLSEPENDDYLNVVQEEDQEEGRSDDPDVSNDASNCLDEPVNDYSIFMSCKSQYNDVINELMKQCQPKSGNENENGSSQGLSSEDKTRQLKQDLEKILSDFSAELPDESQTGFVTVWDFAGQSVFYTTHQAFLSEKAIYILVTNVTKPLDHIVENVTGISGLQKGTVEEFIIFWLNTIHTHSKESKKGAPRVILVATHKDELPKENRKNRIEEHFDAVREVFWKRHFSAHLVSRMFCIDGNNPDDEDLIDLRSTIIELAEKDQLWGDTIPTSWLYLEQSITREREKGKKILGFEDVLTLNRFSAVPLASKDQVQLFLRFHHATGTFLYYAEKGLDDMVILEPQWLVNAFKCFVTADCFLPSAGLDRLRHCLRETAHLSNECIEAVWSADQNDKMYMENKEFILKVLEKMDIIAKPKCYNQDGHEVAKGTQGYLVPCLLKGAHGDTIQKWLTANTTWKTPALGFLFKNKFMPPGVFFRLLSICMTRYPVFEQIGKKFIFCNLAIFRLDKKHFMLLSNQDYLIRAWVMEFSINDKLKETSNRQVLCDSIRKFLVQTLKEILKVYHDCLMHDNIETNYQVVLQCQKVTSTFDGMILWTDLTSCNQVLCTDHESIHVIESNSLLDCWQYDQNLRMIIYSKILTQSFIKRMTERSLSREELSYKTLGRLARKMPMCGEQLGPYLGLDNDTVQSIIKDNREIQIDACFQILRKWYDTTTPENRTIKYLKKNLKEIERDPDVLDELEDQICDFTGRDDTFLDGDLKDKQIDMIKARIGYIQQQLGIELGLKPSEIETIHRDNRQHIDQTAAILHKWKQQTKTPSIREIAKAIHEVDENYTDILDNLY